jgi:ferritin-like metal-binding protein YciE
MPVTNAQELFLHDLRELYDAEHRFVEGQQEMAEKANAQDLKGAIQNHIGQTEQHVRNLEQVFRELGQEPERATNEVAQGLVSEAREGMQEAQTDALRDCAINASVIMVEHFEIGSYRGLANAAGVMGHTEIVHLLNQNLSQEEETASIAENSVGELLRKAT